MKDFFSKTFYENTVLDWAIALLIVVGGIIISRIVYWIIKKVVRRITSKTKTKFDDILVDMAEEPIAFAIIIIGIWIGFNHLEFSSPSIRDFVKNIYFFLITFNAAWLLTRFLDALIREYITPYVEKSEGDLDDQLLPLIRKSIKVVIWILAIVIGLNNAGYDVGALIAGLGIGGLAFAMAAKDTVANLFGGFTILTDKPFKLKDRVKIDGFDGNIIEIGIRSTRLRTLQGRVVTIPNAFFASKSIENISSEPSRKINLNLGLTYNTSPENIELSMKILKEIIHKNPGTREKVNISFNAFNDSALNLLLIYYIKKGADIFAVESAVNLEILKQFNLNKLEFAYPTQTIYTLNN
jgi:MscS family membrane protein